MCKQQGSRYESPPGILVKLCPIFYWFTPFFCDKAKDRIQRHHILRALTQISQQLEIAMPVGPQSDWTLLRGARLVRKQPLWPTSLLLVYLVSGFDTPTRHGTKGGFIFMMSGIWCWEQMWWCWKGQCKFIQSCRLIEHVQLLFSKLVISSWG